MNISVAIEGGKELTARLMAAFQGEEFARAACEVLAGLVGDDVPAPKSVEVNTDSEAGVMVKVTGLVRNGRTPKRFHDTFTIFRGRVRKTIEDLIAIDEAAEVPFTCAFDLDAEIETTPGSGQYGTRLEHSARVSRSGAPNALLETSAG